MEIDLRGHMCGPILQQTVPEAPPLLPSLDTTPKGLAHRLLFPRSHPDLLFQHTLSTELTLLLATYMHPGPLFHTEYFVYNC